MILDKKTQRDFARLVERTRKQKHLSQKELTERLGYKASSISLISKIENAEIMPNQKQALALAKVLDIQPQVNRLLLKGGIIPPDFARIVASKGNTTKVLNFLKKLA